jgi:hypothetical protein
VAIAWMLVGLWLGTRGQMMAIRGVATSNATLGELWNATAAAGTGLFKFHLVLMAIGAVVFVPLLVLAAVILIPIFQDTARIEDTWPALVAIAVVALLACIPFALVGAFTRNFVAPVMLKEGLGARDAWKRFWAVGKSHVGAIVLFFLLRFLVSLGAQILATIVGFVTCCIGFLPVLHQTIMAPWYVFERAWSLEALASLGPEFDLVVRTPQPPPWGAPGGVPPAGYGQPPYGSYGSPGPHGGAGGPGPYGGPPPQGQPPPYGGFGSGPR